MNPRILAAIFAAAALPVAAETSPTPAPSPAKPEARATPVPKAAAPQGKEAAKLAKAQNRKPRKKGETHKPKKAAAT